MEKDSMVAHGMGQFLKERMMETSDISKVYVCDDCGLLLWNGGGWVKEEEEEPRLIVMRVRKEQKETN